MSPRQGERRPHAPGPLARELHGLGPMSRVIVKRRPDGIVQIARRPAWRVAVGPVTLAILAFLLLSLLALGGLAVLLVRFPLLLALVGGLVILLLSAARYALQERHPGPPAHTTHPRPPLDAA